MTKPATPVRSPERQCSSAGVIEAARDPTRLRVPCVSFLTPCNKVRGEELHYAPVTASSRRRTVRETMTFTSTADLEFLCRVANEGRVDVEYGTFLDVARFGETWGSLGAAAFAPAARGPVRLSQHGRGGGRKRTTLLCLVVTVVWSG